VIKRTINNWLESVEDKELAKEMSGKIIVTGGCIASMLLDEKVNDFDVYFADVDIAEKVAKYYVNQFAQNPPLRFSSGQKVEIGVMALAGRIKILVKSAGVASEEGDEGGYQFFETAPPQNAADYVDRVVGDPELEAVIRESEDVGLPDVENEQLKDLVEDIGKDLKDKRRTKFRPVFLTSNAITLSDNIQLCIRFCGSPEEIHKNFDFVHCCNYYTHATGELVLKKEALEALLTKELRYVGSLYPICSLIRVRKFLKRGWSCNAGQFIKMIYQVNALNLSDIKVLEDQLTGVDAAYFAQLIQLIKSDIVERNVEIDQTYIIELIDRLF
jgi:hypothetical protein